MASCCWYCNLSCTFFRSFLYNSYAPLNDAQTQTGCASHVTPMNVNLRWFFFFYHFSQAFSTFMFLSMFIVQLPTAKGATVSRYDTIYNALRKTLDSKAPTQGQNESIAILKAHMALTKDTLDIEIRRSDLETTNTAPPTPAVAKLRSKRNRIFSRRSRQWNPFRLVTQQGRKHPTRPSNLLGSTNVHPCNTVETSEMSYTVDGIRCRRWDRSELQNRMKCMGTYSPRYLASSFEEALRFKDLDSGDIFDLSKSYIWHHLNNAVIKRNSNIKPGETLISQCHAKKTRTESGHLRICPTCAAITRQPAMPRRFPEYINELLCDPKKATNLPVIGGFCVQKSFTLDLLQFNGEWQLDPKRSVEAGLDVYTEKWTTYTQKIRRHCACELVDSSPIARMLWFVAYTSWAAESLHVMN